MTGSIFDELDEPRTGTIFDVSEKVDHLVPDEHHDEEMPWYKSWASALGKGLIKGTGQLGRMMGPLDEPYDQEAINRRLDELIPTREGFIEGALERGGELFPMVATGGGGALSSVARTGGAALSGQTAKEFGFPEWAQSLAELPALVGPEVTKMIQANRSNKEIIDFARRMGMQEEEIAPLIQSAKKQKALGRIAKKRGKAQKSLAQSKEAIGEIYKQHYTHPSSKTVLSEVDQARIIEKMDEQMQKMPSKVRESISSDFIDLKNSPKAAEDFMNFHADINANLSDKTKQLSILKKPTMDALKKIDPNLAKNFNMTNKLYANWSEIAKTLKPTLASDLLEGSVPVRFVLGLSTGYTPIIAEVLTETTGKKIATDLLVNPRFQGLGKKMVKALNQNKFAAAQNTWDVMTKEVDKVDKQAARKMRDIKILEIFEEDQSISE